MANNEEEIGESVKDCERSDILGDDSKGKRMRTVKRRKKCSAASLINTFHPE